jgi:Tim17/Tim22/Tim23/Pmp24 family
MGGDGEDKDLLGAVTDGMMMSAPMGFVVGSAKAFLSGHSPEAKAAASAAARGAVAATASYTHPVLAIAGHTGAFASLGAVYCGTEQLLKSTRGKSDVWNKAIAGCSAGSVVGVRSGSVAAGGGACAAFAAMALLVDVFDGNAGPTVNETLAKRRKLYEPSTSLE